MAQKMQRIPKMLRKTTRIICREFGQEKKGQIAIEPNFAPGQNQPTMGRIGIRRIKFP
jgi:hypothetical protein